MTDRPLIGITMGDPVGVGPEVVLKALRQKSLYVACRPVVLGDVGVLAATNDRLGTGLAVRGVDTPESGNHEFGTVDVVGLSSLAPGQFKPGQPSPSTGRAMVRYITQGIEWALDNRIQGLATCPINKMAMHTAGFHFQGHTEILAEKTGTPEYVMMLAGNKLRVALATIHLPLSQVSRKLTTEKVLQTIAITEEALRNSFGVGKPRLAVAGLNPHAGEDGLFGDEEKEVISPAIRQALERGLDVSGPYPPDTLFYWALKGNWDAVVSMYHDQGLIPFKMVHFEDGVNTTLGLPIIRTSVDHGTAYDIAGKGEANPESLVSAITMAADHAKVRAKQTPNSFLA